MARNSIASNRVFQPQSRWVKSVGYLIFFSRWLQAPLYLGLIIAQLVYVVVFVIELVHLTQHVFGHWYDIDEAVIMLAVLGLIDVVMIANLLIMVIIGGYETFVSKIDLEGHPDQPEWLSHVNANVLKVKLAMAIIGISSIHLLKTFIEVGDLGAPGAASASVTGEVYTGEGVLWQVVIHSIFIASAIALAMIDRFSQASHGPLVGYQSPGMVGVAATTASSATSASGAGAPSVPLNAVPVSGYLIDGKFVQG